MKTIGSRLTFLYVCAVAGVMLATFLLGKYLLENQIRRTLDGTLAEGFYHLRNRLTTDPVRSNLDLAVLLPRQTSATPLYVQVEDLWSDPSFREARMRGDILGALPAPRFFDSIWEKGEKVRVVEGVMESLRLKIATPLLPVSEALHSYTRIGLSVTAVVLLLSLIAGRLLSRAALRPVRVIQQTAMRIRSDNLSERIPVKEVRDEISGLAHLLNQTFDRLESSFEQINRFSADASHEMKTPLSLIRLNVERLLSDRQLSASAKESLQDVIEEIHRLDKLIEKLLFLSRAQAGEVELDRAVHDPQEFIQAFLQDSKALAEARGVNWSVASNPSGRVSFDESRIRQVLFNLLANALDATATGGHVVLRSQLSDRLWQITIEDDGVGLPANKCEIIFDRFIRVGDPLKPVRAKSAGLGLAICRTIIQLHRGRIFAQPRSDQNGLRLTIEIPLAGGSP